jgi:hypothetical protein
MPAIKLADTAALNTFKASLNNAGWVDALNEMRDQVDGQIKVEQMLVASSVAVGGSLSVGYVVWLLRGGLLLSSLLSSLPAWQSIDPMPVLARGGDADEEADDDLDPLEKLFGKAKEAMLKGIGVGQAATGQAVQPGGVTPDRDSAVATA